MKRTIFITLFVLCICGMLFAGGGGQAARRGTGNPGLLSDGTHSLSIFLPDIGQITSSFEYDDNIFTQFAVRTTGINLEITASTSADAVQRRNILLSTGDYPEVLFYEGAGITLPEMSFYASEGIFIPLDPYDPLSFPNIRQIHEEYPGVRDISRGPDGMMYAIPEVADYFHTRRSNNQHLYHQPFMLRYTAQTGRGVPQTLDEFTTYLRWIRDNDANGNGNPNDEVPLAFASGGLRVFIDYFVKAFMPFVFTQHHFGLAREGNRVIEQYRDPRFREALVHMAMMYNEGLIYPDSFVQPTQSLQALTSTDPTVLGAVLGGGGNNFGTDYYYWARWLPVLRGPRGDQWTFDMGPWQPLRARVVVTDKCAEPKLAVAFVDWLMNFDVFMTGYLGPQGEAWEYAQPGALNLIGGPAMFNVLRSNGQQIHNTTWNQVFPMNRSFNNIYQEQARDVPNIIRFLETGDSALFAQMSQNPSYNEVKNVIQGMARIPYETPVDRMIPPLPAMSDASTRRIADIDAVLQDTLNQAMVEFIVGIRNINSDAAWNAFLADLERVGSREKASIIERYLR